MRRTRNAFYSIWSLLAATFLVLCQVPVQAAETYPFDADATTQSLYRLTGNDGLPARGTVDGGGGGKGVLCSYESNLELTVLDLYEATHIHGFIEAPRLPTIEHEFYYGFFKLVTLWITTSDNLAYEAGNILRVQKTKTLYNLENYGFIPEFKAVPLKRRLPLTQDASIPVLPTNCRIVQIAIFKDATKQVFFDEDYWNMLDNRNKSALNIHEIAYQVRRTYGAKSSNETRHFVGQLFSTTPPTPFFQGMPKTGYLDCVAGIQGKTPNYDFYVYLDKENRGTVITFRMLADVSTLRRTTAISPDADLMEKIISSDTAASLSVSLPIHSESQVRNQTLMINKIGPGKLQLQVRDTSTGQSNIPSNAFCRLK